MLTGVQTVHGANTLPLPCLRTPSVHCCIHEPDSGRAHCADAGLHLLHVTCSQQQALQSFDHGTTSVCLHVLLLYCHIDVRYTLWLMGWCLKFGFRMELAQLAGLQQHIHIS